jgi:hypothetical protein
MVCTSRFPCALAAAIAIAIALAGCDSPEDAARSPRTAAFETGLVGSPAAGGATSGEVIAATKAGGVNPKEQGTPGIPQGAEGNVGGTQVGGTVDHETSLGGTGEKSPAQAAKAAPDRPSAAATASPAAR